ncbi:predicted protein [Verticillium alfalfae VaMs.102]|uniref:Predicted protein n=1 Tax=Verticillium alfalfae (strain VaMs.102 / ATCC MYA-4576 / FGSC 10136) TaxID=526221 RepID=C9SJ49_VERA1|nr:predicted protein [Verticillium alfalfae VaMs.102]EEY18972.1 predicted protein [Verticillium alfalfae VaMs.102]
MFYHDVEPGLAAKVAATLLPVAQEIMHGKCEFEPWNQGFNVSYIFTQEDSTLPFEVQQAMASQFPEGSFTISLLTSHSPFLSAPKELGNAIQACIKYTGKFFSSQTTQSQSPCKPASPILSFGLLKGRDYSLGDRFEELSPEFTAGRIHRDHEKQVSEVAIKRKNDVGGASAYAAALGVEVDTAG